VLYNVVMIISGNYQNVSNHLYVSTISSILNLNVHLVCVALSTSCLESANRNLQHIALQVCNLLWRSTLASWSNVYLSFSEFWYTNPIPLSIDLFTCSSALAFFARQVLWLLVIPFHLAIQSKHIGTKLFLWFWRCLHWCGCGHRVILQLISHAGYAMCFECYHDIFVSCSIFLFLELLQI
jgi:hypothetical protein